jgi:serine protease Do
MPRTLPFAFLLALPLACTLTSCNEESKQEVKKAREEISSLESEIAELKSKTSTLDDLEKKAAESKNKADATQKELEKTREETEALKSEIEKLRKDNQKLQTEVTAKTRNRAVGEEHPEVTTSNGRTYRLVTIRKVDDTGVAISHEAGSTTLRADTAPAEWVSRFKLVDEAALAAAAAAAAPPAPVEPTAANIPPKGSNSGKDQALRDKLGGVLLVETDTSAGSGFVVAQDGALYLYTATHVLTGGPKLRVKNAQGMTLTSFGACQVATDCDLARIEVNVKPELALKIGAPGATSVGHEITAAGNSAGSGVVTLTEGKVTGIGPTELEVSAAVIQGNSGGPILSTASGEVFGVVTRAENGRDDIWAADTEFSKIRRFASRIDRPVPWRTASLENLQTENTRIATFDSRTRLVYAMAALEPGQNGLRLDMQLGGGSGPTIMAIFTEHQNVAPVQKLIQMNRQLAERQLRSSERDLKKRFAGFYNDLIRLFANDTSNFEPENFSFPNRRSAEESLKWRKDATKLLQTAAAELGR